MQGRVSASVLGGGTHGVVHVPHVIGGTAIDGDGAFEVRDPGRYAEVVATVADAGADAVDRAVSAAEAGGREWAAVSLEDRLNVLTQAADQLDSLVESLAPTLARENGALLGEARMDLGRGVALLRATLETAGEFLRPRLTETPAARLLVGKKPVGVTALIVPWNSPVVLAMSKVAPALAAGNPVVLKPSPEAPVVLTQVMSVLAGLLPDGAVNVVNSSRDAGPALTAHPRVRKVSFTGSTAVGKAVMRAAADNVKRLSLELGGNDPAIILDDADFGAIMDPLCRGVFTRAGQICFAVKRIYVPRSRYAEFTEAMRAEVDGYIVGHGLGAGVTFGPLISRRQLESVEGLLRRTRMTGATVHELGSFTHPGLPAEGHYMRPVLVTDIEHGAELVSCEQFGPVIPVVPYDTVAQAVEMANDSEFGLASSVWGNDAERAMEVAGRLEAGCSFVNSHNLWSLSFDMPFGGVKQSGLGRERTALGIQEYVEDHAVRWVKPAS